MITKTVKIKDIEKACIEANLFNDEHFITINNKVYLLELQPFFCKKTDKRIKSI